MIQCLNDSMSKCGNPPGILAVTGRALLIMRQYATSSYMRKWMTERLKRRKKPGEGSTKEATSAPEPLQPRIYDNEDAPPPAPVAPPVVQARRLSRPEPAPAPAPESVSAEAAASTAGEPRPRTPRRRRSRGGRGGGRSRPGATAAAPAVVAETSATGEASAAEATKPVVAGKAPAQAMPAPARPSKGPVVLAI